LKYYKLIINEGLPENQVGFFFHGSLIEITINYKQ